MAQLWGVLEFGSQLIILIGASWGCPRMLLTPSKHNTPFSTSDEVRLSFLSLRAGGNRRRPGQRFAILRHCWPLVSHESLALHLTPAHRQWRANLLSGQAPRQNPPSCRRELRRSGAQRNHFGRSPFCRNMPSPRPATPGAIFDMLHSMCF